MSITTVDSARELIYDMNAKGLCIQSPSDSGYTLRAIVPSDDKHHSLFMVNGPNSVMFFPSVFKRLGLDAALERIEHLLSSHLVNGGSIYSLSPAVAEAVWDAYAEAAGHPDWRIHGRE